MSDPKTEQIHSFHIPVMGTGFTIDTPLKVARFGISSVVSVGDDRLIEKIRGYYCGLYGEPYIPITDKEYDVRARRITAYLDFLDRQVGRQIEEMRSQPFESGSDPSRYFEMLPEEAPLKKEYLRMVQMTDPHQKNVLQRRLRAQMVPGSIDINIMTKADRENKFNQTPLPREYSDACSALRGFALSGLSSSVVFSAGLNLFLYGYLSDFEDFIVDSRGFCKKKIILKVSDFRSAAVQAKIFAKKGIWVSEYRVESGLNCGGHAFATQGHLLGPILEEFQQKKDEMLRELFVIFRKAVTDLGRACPDGPPPVRFTAQGGVGTGQEHHFLKRFYHLDSIGWGTPFLLVPEATSVDDATLQKLVDAGEEDIVLSKASPLGVPFYTLRNSASEQKRRDRIEEGKPGSPCLSKYLAMNPEFGEPLCTASFSYQSKKIDDLRHKHLSEEEYQAAFEGVTAKACICRDLGDGALMKYGIKDEKKVQTPAICPGPNLAFFSKVCSLKEMIDHIYGRVSVLNPAVKRPHFFVNELKLNVNFFKKNVLNKTGELSEKEKLAIQEFKDNLIKGIDYYRRLVSEFVEESEAARQEFLQNLALIRSELLELV